MTDTRGGVGCDPALASWFVARPPSPPTGAWVVFASTRAGRLVRQRGLLTSRSGARVVTRYFAAYHSLVCGSVTACWERFDRGLTCSTIYCHDWRVGMRSDPSEELGLEDHGEQTLHFVCPTRPAAGSRASARTAHRVGRYLLVQMLLMLTWIVLDLFAASCSIWPSPREPRTPPRTVRKSAVFERSQELQRPRAGSAA